MEIKEENDGNGLIYDTQCRMQNRLFSLYGLIASGTLYSGTNLGSPTPRLSNSLQMSISVCLDMPKTPKYQAQSPKSAFPLPHDLMLSGYQSRFRRPSLMTHRKIAYLLDHWSIGRVDSESIWKTRRVQGAHGPQGWRCPWPLRRPLTVATCAPSRKSPGVQDA